MAQYRRGRHSVTGIYAHLVFVTKYRRLESFGRILEAIQIAIGIY
ncbi:MAG: hypothetical protein AAGE96_02250 [Cyanobacteria bacterium P01_G01_bin.19]